MSGEPSMPHAPQGERSDVEHLRTELADAHGEIERLRRLLAHPLLSEERRMLREALDAAIRGSDLAAYRLRTYH